MKLSYRRTILVGLAFLSICAFWQLYDNVVPLILKNTFGVEDTVSGVIMALDNVLALFLLPLLGAWSDRTKTRLGRRTPFILAGTALAVLFMMLIPAADNRKSFPLFIVALGVVLLSMGLYRSPAVALMPDVTPKPLRSKANAIINLMGALGGIYTLVMTKILVSGEGTPDYTQIFIATGALMAGAVLLLLVTVRERSLAATNVEEEPAQAAQEGQPVKEKMPPAVFKSFAFLLSSIFLWFMGYNAVTTAFTKYAQANWSMNIGAASTCLLVATGGAILSYIPVGIISSKIGRKKVILAGIVILAACFSAGIFFTEYSPFLNIAFALIGVAWASINVNSYPMVVEMSKTGDIGKYTGYYYTFSMSAQIITPILSGALLEHVGYWTLFPYAAVLIGLAFVTMTRVRHGDNRPDLPQSRLELFETQD